MYVVTCTVTTCIYAYEAKVVSSLIMSVNIAPYVLRFRRVPILNTDMNTGEIVKGPMLYQVEGQWNSAVPFALTISIVICFIVQVSVYTYYTYACIRIHMG